MDGLDLNGVASFAAVVAERSFRGAARVLGVPKSTVSRRVAALESQLGTQLLRRTTRTVVLTDAGEAFHPRAAAALGTLGEAAREVRERGGEPRGVLRMTAPASFGENYLGPVITEFLGLHPAVQVALDLSDRYVDIVREGYDLAIRAGALPDSSLRARRLGTNPVHFVASPAYLAARGTPGKPGELADHDCIIIGSTEQQARWSMLVKKKVVPVPIRGRVAANSLPLTVQFALAGLGIARLPEVFCAEALADGRLVRVLAKFETPPTPMHAVFPPGAHPPARVQAFMALFAERFEQIRPPSITLAAPTVRAAAPPARSAAPRRSAR